MINSMSQFKVVRFHRTRTLCVSVSWQPTEAIKLARRSGTERSPCNDVEIPFVDCFACCCPDRSRWRSSLAITERLRLSTQPPLGQFSPEASEIFTLDFNAGQIWPKIKQQIRFERWPMAQFSEFLPSKHQLSAKLRATHAEKVVSGKIYTELEIDPKKKLSSFSPYAKCSTNK